MEPNECYSTLRGSHDKLVDYVLWQAQTQKLWMWSPQQKFVYMNLDMDHVFSLCPILETIHNTIAKIKGVGISKMLSDDHYKLHKDIQRGVGINMLCQSQKSFSAFVDSQDKQTVLMDYYPNKLHIFKTQIPHTVFNFLGERIMFAVGFEELKSFLPYRGFIKRLKKAQKLTGSLSLIE